MEAERFLLVPSHRLVLVPAAPVFEWREWARTMESIFGDARFHPPMSFVVDRRNVLKPYPRSVIERILRFLSTNSSYMRGCSWATLVPDLNPVRDAVRIVSTLASPCGVNIRAFVEFEAALEWAAPNARRGERETYLNWFNVKAGNRGNRVPA